MPTLDNSPLRFIGPALLVLVVVGLYAPSMSNGFVYDDTVLILNQARPESLVETFSVFGERHWYNLPYYRPIPRLTMVVQKYLHGDNAGPYHLFNAVLMGAAALLAYALLRLPFLKIPRIAALVGAGLFALHPIASSTVYPICSGRESLIPALFAIGAVWAFARVGLGWYLLAMAMLALALLSKEQAVIVPGLFVLADAMGVTAGAPGRSVAVWVRRYVPVAVITGTYLLIRLSLFGGQGQHQIEALTEPAGPLRSFFYALQTTFLPYVDLAYEPRPEVWMAGWRPMASVIVVGVLAVWVGYRWAALRKTIVFWLGWAGLALLPTANIVHQETHYAERFVFLASLGLIGLVLTLALTVWQFPLARRVLSTAAILLVVASAAISFQRAGSYRDEITFLNRWVESDPGSAKAHHGLGQHLATGAKWNEAKQEFQQAVALAPDYAAAHNNLGSVLVVLQEDLEQAELHFMQALTINPEYTDALNNLAAVRTRQGNLDEAFSLYLRSLEIKPEAPRVHWEVGELYESRGDVESAVAHKETSLALGRPDADRHNHVGYLLLRRDPTRAREHFRRALEIDPDNPRPHNNLGILSAEAGELDDAAAHFERALRSDPDYAQAHVNLGNLLLLRDNPTLALAHLEQALELDPDSKSARESLDRANAALGRE